MDGPRETNKAAWVFMFLSIHKFYQVSLRSGSIFPWISTIHCLPLLPYCLSQLSSSPKGCVGAHSRWLRPVTVGVSGSDWAHLLPSAHQSSRSSYWHRRLWQIAGRVIDRQTGVWSLLLFRTLGAPLMRKSQSLPRIPGTDIKLDDSEGDDWYYNGGLHKDERAIMGN